MPGQAQSIHASILDKMKEDGVTDVTGKFGSRLVEKERCAYLRPWVIHCDSPERKIANTEYMFPYVTVVECAQEDMIEKIGAHAWQEIAAQASDWKADLIVVGTHGRRGLKRLVMGSDAELVLRHSPVPVLMVRDQTTD